jgi:hypothetical protein
MKMVCDMVFLKRNDKHEILVGFFEMKKHKREFEDVKLK